jgi:pilus assembly protein Flp/PilA
MSPLTEKVLRFLKAEDGPTAVEYATMLMLILLVCLSVITVIGQTTQASLENSSDSIAATVP